MSTSEDGGGSSESLASTTTKRTRFTFVCESTQSSARSHAMREHWRERKRRGQVHKPTRIAPILRPKAARIADDAYKAPLTQSETSLARLGEPDTNTGRECESYVGTPRDDTRNDPSENTVASALLLGINRVLCPSRLDPFDTFPVRLTSDHHKLLYHCTRHLGLLRNNSIN